MTSRFLVIKVGGAILETCEFRVHLASEIASLRNGGFAPVVVHGGGRTADRLQERLGVPTRKWKGRRITDDDTLRVVKMAYRGVLHTDLVAALSANGVRALGMCGSDGWVVARKRSPVNDPDAAEPIDFGWVGDIERVDITPLSAAVAAGFTPVIASLAVDPAGNVLNVNADALAVTIAGALPASSLFFLTDVDGILADPKDPASVIPRMTLSDLKAAHKNGTLTDGMLPKADAIAAALTADVARVFVAGGFAPLCEKRDPAPEKWRGTLVTRHSSADAPSTNPRDPLSVLREIIALPSVSGEEHALADYLEALLNSETVEVRRDGFSVVAVRGSPRGPTMLLNAHTDTVPPAQGWSLDPFKPTERDGFIFGLGAADCKGPLAALLSAFLQCRLPPDRGRVVLTATPEEETGGKDLARIVAALGQMDGAIIAEPTDLRPCISQKGLLRLEMELMGKGAHASRPWQGENAIERAAGAVAALRALNFGPPHPVLGGVTITPTRIQGGDITNRVPERCVISLDIRYPPGIGAADIAAALSRIVPGSARVVSDRILPLETPENSRLMLAVRGSFRAGDLTGMFGASNWALLGETPAIVLGPGSPKCSHSADEHIAVSDLIRGVDVYRRLCEAFVGG